MTDEFERGQSFGAYVLEARLGGGGFGTVWRARETATGKLVALKILAGKFSAGDTGRIRADVELLAAAASSDSRNVVQVLGGGTEPSPHVLMEYIEGPNLEDELERTGALSQRETLRIVKGVAAALETLQRAGIIHRDVKPANVMLARDGTVKLTDFGIAKIAGFETVTATGQLPLSAAYAAPEVWAGEATYQSDFYALGAMTFQCLTGTRPFTGNFVQLFEMHRNREPEYALLPGETPPALRRLIVTCLMKDPGDRPADAAAVLALVEESEQQLASPAADEAPATHSPRALGPWLIESEHPARPWTFKCLHETNGERATVEVHFSDSLEVGESLKRAVAANPTLVPLGAERLLGTNRLILRPGEEWPDQRKSGFMFWVARQELPSPKSAGVVDGATAEAWATAALALVAAGREKGVTVSLNDEAASLGPNGTIYVTRVGLPSGEAQPAVEWLRTAFSGFALFAGVFDDAELATRLAERQKAREACALGIALVAEPGLASEVVDESALVDRSALAAATSADAAITTEPRVVDSAIEPMFATGADAPRMAFRRRRGRLLGGLAAGIVGALSAVGVLMAFGGEERACEADECPTALSTGTATRSTATTLSETSMPTPLSNAGTHIVQAGDTCLAIAWDHGLTLEQFLLANLMSEGDCPELYAGQKLLLPEPKNSHVLSPGDTCPTVAEALGVTLEVLVSANSVLPEGCGYLQVGQVLWAGENPPRVQSATPAWGNPTPTSTPTPSATPTATPTPTPTPTSTSTPDNSWRSQGNTLNFVSAQNLGTAGMSVTLRIAYIGDRGPSAVVCVAAFPSDISEIEVPCRGIIEGLTEVTIPFALQDSVSQMTTSSIHSCLSVATIDIIPCRDWSFAKSWSR